MHDPNLEKLIADSIEEYGAETAAMMAKIERKEYEYRILMQKATVTALAGIDERDKVPVALQPYCLSAASPNRYDLESNIESLRKGWLPNRFIIEAPGLATIGFELKATWDTETRKDKAPRVHAVIAHDGLGHDWETWREAVAKAAKIHADNEKYEREQKTARIERKAMEAAAAPPTVIERLESIIREIVREEINQIQTEDF